MHSALHLGHEMGDSHRLLCDVSSCVFSALALSCFVNTSQVLPICSIMVETGQGAVSQDLFEFALLVDSHVKRDAEWVKKCLAVFAANGLTERHDLVGFKDEDYDKGLEEYGLQSVQHAWLRRCIARVEHSLREGLAEDGVKVSPKDDAGAVRALIDAIKNDEVHVSHGPSVPSSLGPFCVCLQGEADN